MPVGIKNHYGDLSAPCGDEGFIRTSVASEVVEKKDNPSGNRTTTKPASPPGAAYDRGSLPTAAVQKIFPYHVLIDSLFCIHQVGDKLPEVLGTTESILHGKQVQDVFQIVTPKPATWTKSWLEKTQDKEFTLECVFSSAPQNIVFRGTLLPYQGGPNDGDVMLIVSPDAKNFDELRDMNLNLTDLPFHGAYRDTMLLQEKLTCQLDDALQMEHLGKRLQTEKTLLESLLPVHAAEGLRQGQEVKPMLHSSVTMFFSDIVGFTNICKEIAPWQVIDMLNSLYSVMDFLAGKFNLFKIETIGDAYVCASGLPMSDGNHAANVANFSIAVQHCCRRVLSPVDQKPIQLRVGIHSGEAASGIVGVTNPRYCVFGDTVNTTARHESTGEPGRVHCSQATMTELTSTYKDHFDVAHRGIIEMKGKGAVPTYWIKSTDTNPLSSAASLQELDEAVANILSAGRRSRRPSRRSILLQASDGTIERHVLQVKVPAPTPIFESSICSSDTILTTGSLNSSESSLKSAMLEFDHQAMRFVPKNANEIEKRTVDAEGGCGKDKIGGKRTHFHLKKWLKKLKT